MDLLFGDHEQMPRTKLVNRWNELMRAILPLTAKSNHWPISLDHCFMRVCLDTALAGPWHLVVKRPAIRHLTDDQLRAAITVGEGLLVRPEMLEALNTQSIAWRKAVRTRIAQTGAS